MFEIFAFCLFWVNIGQISEWYGYDNGTEYELSGINDGYIIVRVCVRYGWIIDSVGNIAWTNGYQTYINSSMYGGNGGNFGCFTSSTCIRSIIVGLGEYWTAKVISELEFISDNNNVAYGGTNIDDPPKEHHTFNCDNNKCLSKLHVNADDYLRGIMFECDSIRTLSPSMYVYTLYLYILIIKCMSAQ